MKRFTFQVRRTRRYIEEATITVEAETEGVARKHIVDEHETMKGGWKWTPSQKGQARITRIALLAGSRQETE